MVFTKKKDKRTELEKEIDKLIDGLRTVNYDTEDYTKRLQIIERLKSLEDDKSKRRVSPDTVLLVAGNILGILIIVNHERLHVIASKALSHVIRGRV